MTRRSGESGNIFFTLFGAIALVGVVGVATSTLMRGPVGTVLTLNQRAKIESQLQIARKLAALEAGQASNNCDMDDYLEPYDPDVVTAGCNTLITGGGCLPASVGAAKTDPWGTLVGYCGWDHGAENTGCGGLNAGTIGSSKTVLAVISAGPDRAFQTTCGDDPAYVTTGGDDIVFEWTYEEASEGLGGGLWSLKSGDPDAITTSKDVEFASGTSATFDNVRANFGAGSLIDMSGGGLFNLPNESAMPNGQCNATNKGVLRRFTNQPANDQEILQICDGAVFQNIGLAPGGTVAGGNPGEIQYNSAGILDGDSALIWDAANNELGIGVNPDDTLDVNGTMQVTGAVDFDSTLNVDGATTLQTTLNVVGATDLDSTLNVDGAATLQTTLNVVGATDLDSTLNVDGAATLQSTLNAVGATDLDSTLNVDGAATLQTTLNVVGATDLDSTLNVDGAATLQSTLNAVGAVDFDSTLNVDGAGTFQTTLNAKGAVDFESTLNVDGVMLLGANAQAEGGDCSGYTPGAITFDGVNDELLLCSSVAGNKWVTVGTSGGGGGGAGATTVWERNGTVIRSKSPAVYATDDFVFGSTQLADDGDTDHDNRMFFDKSKGAFRAGVAYDAQWDDASVGNFSAAFGANTIASGHYSFATGGATTASGHVSTTMGTGNYASGDYSMAFGNNASVGNSTTPNGTGNASVAFGLIDSAVTITTPPKITGIQSMGLFMGDQDGITLSANNMLALLGGRMVIDPAVPATQTAVSGVLDLDVEGQIGAIQYCDETGANCFTAASVAGGTGAAPGDDREIVFNSADVFATDPNFVFTSTGRLGIGTAAPGHELHVDGSAQVENGTLYLPVGGIPPNLSMAFTGDTDTGFYSGGDGTFYIVSNGTALLQVHGDKIKLNSATAQIEAGFGTAANPTYSFDADDNTGIYRAAADALGFSTAGTEKIRLVSGGALGIGDLSPDGTLLLDVEGQVGATEYCDQNGANCFDVSDIANPNAYGADGVIQFASAGGLWGDSAFIYNSTGMGVGTATPGGKLDVQVNTNSHVLMGPGSETAGQFYMLVNFWEPTEVGVIAAYEHGIGWKPIQIDTGGAGVSIGAITGTPTSALDLGGALTVREMAAPAASAADTGRIYFDETANKFKVSENGGGYVDLIGSGVATSVALSGITAATTDATIASGANNIAWNWKLTAAETGIIFGETTASTGGTIGASGNQFVAKASALAASTATPFIITNLGTANSFRVNDETGDADTTPFVIDASGNVGIGTATPGALLSLHQPTGAFPRLQMTAADVTLPSYAGSGSLGEISASNTFGQIRVGKDASTDADEGGLMIQGFTGSGVTDQFPLRLVGTHGASGTNTEAAVTISGQKWNGTNNRADLTSTETVLNVETRYGGTSLLRVMGDGKVGIGTAAPNTKLHMSGDVEVGLTIASATGSADQNSEIEFYRARGTVAAPTIVSNNDAIAGIWAHAYDGNSYELAAIINFEVDGTPGNGDMPGRIEFHTQADGAAGNMESSTPDMVIKNDGKVGIGTATPNQGKLEVKGGSVCVDTDSDDNASSCIANESDMRLKKNVRDLDYSVETLMKLRPVQFDWKYDDPEILKHYPLISRFSAQPHSIGFLAQDVQKLVPEAIESETVGDGEVQYLQLDYSKLVPLMVKAAQEQQGDITALKDENEKLKAELAQTQLTLADMQEDIKGLKAYTGYGITRAEIGWWAALAMAAFYAGGLRARRSR